MELSVVLPAYNEAKSISSSLKALTEVLAALQVDYEIIVVDDGSTDDTLTRARAQEGVKVITYERNQGKGYAVREGMRLACGQYRLFMDVDLSTDLSSIEVFLKYMRQQKPAVLIAHRSAKALFEQDRPWHRALLGRLFALLSSGILGFWHKDITCGFKMFTAKAAQEIFARQQLAGWAFDSELLFIAHQQQLSIVELPVQWHHAADSKVRLGAAAINSLIELLKIRVFQIRGCYR